MTKTLAQYDQLFEDLMVYTDFSSADKIKTQSDLNSYFVQIKNDANSRGHRFNASGKLKGSMMDALGRLTGRIKSTGRVREIETIKKRVIDSRKVFLTFKEADAQDMTTVNPKGERVFKTRMLIKGKGVFRYRNRNGSLASAPTTHDLLREAGGTSLIKDQKKTAKTVVKTKKEYKKRGARKVDLTGYDTKEAEK